MPISDGGDGLIESLRDAWGGRLAGVWVAGPLGERRRARYLWAREGRAVIEMARASGLALVPSGRRDALRATSFGTGQLIDAALGHGARTVIVGLGGSASNDGGAGMAQALGARLLDARGREIGRGAGALLGLAKVEAGALRSRLRGVRVLAVSDVTNPLLGPRGSAAVYGPQKGATPSQVRVLERALARYARVLSRDLGVSVSKVPGGGAAGGLGAGLLAFLGAKIVPGASFVLRAIGAREKLRGAAAALTGEGRLDRTSFFGKAPVEFSRLCLSLAVPAAVVCGQVDPAVKPALRRSGIGVVVALEEAGASSRDSIEHPGRWAARAAARAMRQMLLAAVLLGPLAGAQAAAAARKDPALSAIDGRYLHRHEGRNLEESVSRLEALLLERPEAPEFLWRLGRSLVRQGERLERKRERLNAYERAEEFLRRAVALAPQEAEARFWLGVAMGRRGQARGLLKSLFLVGPIRREMREVLRLDPGHGGAHHVLGEILWQLPGIAGGDKKAAVKEFEEAVRLTPRYTANHISLAQAYLAMKERDKAVDVLNQVFAVSDPADPAEYPDNAREARELLLKLGRSR